MPGTNFFTPITSALQVALTDGDGLVVFARCTGTPPTTVDVFQHGCIILQVDSGTGNKALYENIGLPAAPSWNLIGAIVAGEITLANGKVFIGGATNVAAEQILSGDVTITNDGVVAISAAAVTQPKVKTKTVVALADAAAILTAAQMIDSGIFTITPTVARALTTATAAELVAAMTGYQVGTWFEITIVCLAAFAVTLAGGTGVTIVGGAAVTNASATFKVRFDSPTAVTIYRM